MALEQRVVSRRVRVGRVHCVGRVRVDTRMATFARGPIFDIVAIIDAGLIFMPQVTLVTGHGVRVPVNVRPDKDFVALDVLASLGLHLLFDA